ncbi:uncharacterized protein LOC120779462 [Bactrocera tryoni]|uniref:uncharacterized protein LOC120779462 n=1 Tax=Bactrocera tryoni TaxID=59916 RepID=UPI001A973009|nr:uncharacterized protein LOC120779462 [Bactrocera tryoni]
MSIYISMGESIDALTKADCKISFGIRKARLNIFLGYKAAGRRRQLKNVEYSNLRCVQINLQYSKCATANLTTLINLRGINISLTQEPWVKEDTINGLNSSNCKIFYTLNKA